MSVDTWAVSRATPNGSPFGALAGGQVMEQYSVAFVHAVATRARCKLENLRVDDEQVDVTIRQVADHLHYSRVALDVQLKCTSQKVIRSDGVHFSLPMNQYDGLRSRSLVPKALVTLCVDPDFDRWMSHDVDQLILRGRANWLLTNDLPEKTGDSTTVILPSGNQFSPDQLLDILADIGSAAAA